MSQLVNLVEYKQQLEQEVQNANLTDCVLPESFKSKFTSFHGYNFEYYDYTLKVSTSQGECYIPNQWIFIGALCSQYHSELLKYKEKLVNYGITDDGFRRCHPGRDDRDIPEEERTQEYLQNLAGTYLENYQNEDKELLINFLWNYDSWGGGKNLSRGDFTASPVLSIAHSINASSGLIGIIAQALAEDQLLRQELFDSIEWKQLGRFNQTGIISDETKYTYKSPTLQQLFSDSPNKDKFLPYITSLRTKPFMLLAGISGTGKSRIVRELAKACWKESDEEYGKNCPKNFCMVQVKPNWHDSTELFGYVSRISGKPEFVAGDFLKFIIKAWENSDVPYFLCLDEMNLAPVEQYFAEYLSVIESRKSDGQTITTDPIFKKPFEDKKYDDAVDYEEGMDWYQKFIVDNTSNKNLRQQFYKNGITIPNNLFVIGTVNMDETTFSFSRKVLDRAMTFEMNEVDLYGGLDENSSKIGYIGNCIIGNAAEGKDVYSVNKELCNQVLAYLEKVNTVLEGTPFKIAYRTRNEFLLYAVNRLLLDKESQLWQTLDEMTSMKILSRIEGDSERTKTVLEGLKALVDSEIMTMIPKPEEGKEKAKSITDAKIKEMLKKLESGYTSYWA